MEEKNKVRTTRRKFQFVKYMNQYPKLMSSVIGAKTEDVRSVLAEIRKRKLLNDNNGSADRLRCQLLT